jgi:PKD repeat protein
LLPAKSRQEQPIAEFTIRPRTPRIGQTVELFDDSSDPDGVGVAWRVWDFGDGGTATGASPTHRYAEPGAYVITLTLATFDGRLASSKHAVAVREPGASRVEGVRSRCYK